MHIKNKIIISFLLFLPSTSFAQFTLASSDFRDFIGEVLSVLNLLIPLFIGVAFIAFFWGVAKFILHSGNAQEVTTGKNYIFWGVIAIFVLLSFMGIVAFLTSEFGFGNSSVGGVFLPGQP